MLDTSRNGDVAHLVPTPEHDGNTWWFIPPLLFGATHNWTSTVREKAIHGYARQAGSRQSHTGIKHMVTNKLRVPGQGQYLDSSPCLLIIPILTTDRVKNWNGFGYEAIVLIDQWDDWRLQDVALGTEMFHPDGIRKTASTDDVETARVLLVVFLRAILTSRKARARDIPADNLYMGNDIIVPSQCTTWFPVVRKIQFVAQSWESDPEKHPAPDPLLLAARAAVVFSSRHNQTLAASSEPLDENWTDLDQQAADEYLEWREASLRAHMDADLEH